VGCYLAHLRALRQAYDEGLERVCLFEDDVELEPDFAQVLCELEQLPDGVEMVRLMGLKIRKRKVIKTLSDGRHQLVRPERGALGAQGYLINRIGMRKLLDHGSRIYEPIDKLYDHFWEYDLRLYGVEPHIIYEAVSGSTIVKSNVAKADVAPWLHWFYPLGKLFRSINRHWYLKRNHGEFYPADLPSVKPGRTERMKGKIK
jgi:glycosyl transferase family 25